MAGKRLHPESDAARAAPQTTTTLPRRTRRRSSPQSASLPNGTSAAVKPAAATTAIAQEDHAMDEASDAESDSSVLSTSSEEPSSDSDDDSQAEGSDEENTAMDSDEITALPRPPDADARRKIYQRQVPPKSTIGDRLKEFLPQLAAANEELERDRAAGTLAEKSLENVGDNEERYIEFNLGLGVLKEKDPNKMESDIESEIDDDEMDTDANGQNEQKNKEQDILAKLLRKKNPTSGPVIQEVPDQ
ncbi:phosphotransferase-like [Neofusicoccum parvum]|uniref:Phosphotransferase-like n=1 Tax=Neofusicoccum parvum TaxID=310453 RepID=A0ACB5S636_9PEZI|nr:phosphotransferase-like [Neofusicoccum parvum]